MGGHRGGPAGEEPGIAGRELIKPVLGRAGERGEVVRDRDLAAATGLRERHLDGPGPLLRPQLGIADPVWPCRFRHHPDRPDAVRAGLEHGARRAVVVGRHREHRLPTGRPDPLTTRGEQVKCLVRRQVQGELAGEPVALHDASVSRCASAAVRVSPYAALSCSIFVSTGSLNGALPSNACRAIPSTRSPSDTSRYSARPLSTLSRVRSTRSPVWTRSTVTTVPW